MGRVSWSYYRLTLVTLEYQFIKFSKHVSRKRIFLARMHIYDMHRRAGHKYRMTRLVVTMLH